MQMDFKAPEGMEEMFKNMPKENSSKKELLFSNDKSIYQNPDDKIGNEDNQINLGDEEMTFQIHFDEPDEKLFIDLKSKQSVHQQEFMGKKFLVEGEQRMIDWKLGKDKKRIADFICMEAKTTVHDTIPITAWFTPQIPISIGPNGYGGLPGMILQIDRDNGRQVITAKTIDFKAPNIELIVAPKNGKKINKEEYDKIVEEKMVEMKAQHSGSGSTIIEIKN